MTSTQQQDRVLSFNIEGQKVQCFQSGQDRLWSCECEYFQRMLTRHSEGFCPHVAVAIWRAAEQGVIDLGGLDV